MLHTDMDIADLSNRSRAYIWDYWKKTIYNFSKKI